MRFAIIARRPTPTNEALAAVDVPGVPRWELMTPEQALDVLVADDVALGRLDVLPTLDGMDDGLWALGALAARGVVVLNDPPALLGAHDKLLTARLLRHEGIPHPTDLARARRPPGAGAEAPRRRQAPLRELGERGAALRRLRRRSRARSRGSGTRAWFARHGALVQELVPPRGYDLRIVIAEGRAVGSVFRIAAPGEWRTNVALGGTRRALAQPPRGATTIALAAAAATGASLVGVDLLPDGASWTVLELNGAVELTSEYAPWGDVFAEIAFVLGRAALDRLTGRADLAADIA